MSQMEKKDYYKTVEYRSKDLRNWLRLTASLTCDSLSMQSAVLTLTYQMIRGGFLGSIYYLVINAIIDKDRLNTVRVQNTFEDFGSD